MSEWFEIRAYRISSQPEEKLSIRIFPQWVQDAIRSGDIKLAVRAYLAGGVYVYTRRDKARAFSIAADRQFAVAHSPEAEEHERQTTLLCEKYNKKPDLKTLNEIGKRREEWGKKFGVFYKEKERATLSYAAKAFIQAFRHWFR